MTNTEKISSNFPFMNFSLRIPLKRAISEVIKNSDISIRAIVEKMNALTGEEITVSTLRNWSTITHENHIPRADLIPAFCEVTGNLLPLQILLEPLNKIKIISAREAKYFDTLKLEKQESSLIHELRQLSSEISARYENLREIEQ